MSLLKSTVVLLAFIVIMLSFAKAEEKFIWSCHHWNSDSVNIYANCVNNNFMDVERRLNRIGRSAHIWNCPVYYNGQNLTPIFVNCVNNNFRNIYNVFASISPARPMFWHCFDNFREGVSFSFEGCVNGNFDETDRFLPY